MGAGVLAFGDSITNAGGELQLGVALQSWALWTARGLGLPYTPYAVDGARADDVVRWQIPLFERVNADPAARFELGCCYVGTNDSRHPDWDPVRFEALLDEIFGWLAARCDRVLTATVPLCMGRPPDPEAIGAANAAIREAAARHGALVLDLSDFGARNVMMADRVHPTAFGQVRLAERALALLEADGMAVRLAPATLVFPSDSRRVRLESDLRYVFRCTRERLRAAWVARRPR